VVLLIFPYLKYGSIRIRNITKSGSLVITVISLLKSLVIISNCNNITTDLCTKNTEDK